jgi:hypothetical protein
MLFRRSSTPKEMMRTMLSRMPLEMMTVYSSHRITNFCVFRTLYNSYRTLVAYFIKDTKVD